MSTNVAAMEPTPDAAVSSELTSHRDIVHDLVDDARVSCAVGSIDSLDSKTETLTTGSASGGIVRDTRVSGDEIGTVMDVGDKVLDKSSSDAVVSSPPPSNGDITAVDDAKKRDELLDSKNETLTMKSHDHEGGDTVVQDSIDDSRVSGDEKGTVMDDADKDLDKSSSDAVVSSPPLSNGDITAVDDVKKRDELLDSETETLTVKSHDHEGGDTVVQDSIDDSRVSGNEKGSVMENIKKVSDENEVGNEEKEGEYKVTDLVWAKVKDYPWWPGQILDPSSSTDTAKKYSNKKAFLVGYFGDQSFAWNKAPNIKPFRKNFSKLGKQSNSKAFFHAVNCALDEVSRRIEFGLSCSCLSKEVYNNIKTQVFVNAGVKEEASKIDGSDRFSTVSTLKPVKAAQSLQDLAREQFDGFSKLEVSSVRAQLLSFFRWKGYYQLQAQNLLDELDNNNTWEEREGVELPLTDENKVVVEDENPKPKPASGGKSASYKKRKPNDSDSDDSVPRKKERSLKNMTQKSNSSSKRSRKDSSKKSASAGKKVSSKKKKRVDSDSDDS